MSKKDILKKVVKGEAPKATFGTDPSDPWSTKSNINETAILDKYLSSRGINPKFVSKDTKIAHAKSALFAKWKRDHMFEQVFQHTPTQKREHELKKKERHGVPIKTEEVDKKDTITLDIPFMIRVLEYAREDAKDDMALHKVVEKLIELRNKGTLTMDDYDFVTKIKEEFEITEQVKTDSKEWDKLAQKRSEIWRRKRIKVDEAKEPKQSALERFRSAASKRAKEADERRKEMEKRHAAGGEDMKGAIDRLEKSLKKEDTVNESQAHDEGHRDRWYHRKPNSGYEVGSQQHKDYMDAYTGKHKQQLSNVKTFGKAGEIKKEAVEQIDELNYDTVKSLYKKRRDDYHGDKVGQKKKGKKVSAKNVSTSISRIMGFKPTQNKPEPKNEEVEQIDELKKSTVKSWLSKQDVIPPKKPGMDRKAFNKRVKTRSASWDRALDRMTGHKPTSEAFYQDSQAATQSVSDGANTPDDTVTNRRKEMSKSARIIKSIYKKKGVVKEETYDHEKEDKSVATYGKKPKMAKIDDKMGLGDNKPEAAAVLSGGKTLTGEPRDDIEIDPMLKKRPNQPTTDKNGTGTK